MKTTVSLIIQRRLKPGLSFCRQTFFEESWLDYILHQDKNLAFRRSKGTCERFVQVIRMANSSFKYHEFATIEKNGSSQNYNADEDSFIEMFFKCLVYALIVIFSIIGNSLTIAAFKLNINGKLHTVNNMFIVSMAAGDLLLTLGSTPERIIRTLTNDQWLLEGNFGVFLCKLANFLEKLCMNVSIVHVSMVAIDRFFVVFYPRKKIITKKKALWFIIMAWLAPALFCVPLLYYANLDRTNGKVFCKTRVFFKNWRSWYAVFLSFLVITLLLVVMLYAAIAIRLSRKKMPSQSVSFRNRIGARLNIRVLKMVAAILFAFYCCFLPYWVGWVFCSYFVYSNVCSGTYVFTSIALLYANSAINPVIYSFFNINFRVGFRFIFKKICTPCTGKKTRPHRREGRQESYVIMKGIRQAEKVYNGELRCNAIKKVGSGSYET